MLKGRKGHKREDRYHIVQSLSLAQVSTVCSAVVRFVPDSEERGPTDRHTLEP